MNEERAKSYRQLEKRIAREKQLMVAQQKMEIKKMLQVILKNSIKRKMLKLFSICVLEYSKN